MKRYLGIVVGRGGSKGLPGKNLMKIDGCTLTYRVADTLNSCSKIDTCICSTDDIDIAKEAQRAKIEVPFIRPEYLSTDTAKTIDVVEHAIRFMENENNAFTHVVLLQPTSPTVKVTDIEKGINLIETKSFDTVITAFQVTREHPSLMFTSKSNFKLDKWLQSDLSRESRRQEFRKVYVRTGLLYIFSIENILKNKKLYGENIGYVLIEPERAITIDDQNDFDYAKYYIEKRKEKD